MFNKDGYISAKKPKGIDKLYKENIPTTDQREIDMCLSCTEKKCNGNCIKIKRKEYIK